jgi:type II secretory pathway predicted ATPase ExeA
VSDRIERELGSLGEALQHPDPFGPTANPEAYVPCEPMEAALFELVQTVRSERRAAAVSGPPGLGKTLLLHLLADRLGPRIRFVYIPYAALPPEELCTWALDLLGTQASDDPVAMLKAYGEHLRQQGSALLLLVDDAGAMPIDTARMLANLVASSDGGLRLAVASTDSPEASRAFAALGSDIHMIRLIQPMTASETRRYLEARLAMAQVPDAICAHFDEETVAALHRLSGGVPRRLNALAADVMRGIPSEAAAARLDGLFAEAPPEGEVPALEARPPPEPEPDLAEVADDVAELDLPEVAAAAEPAWAAEPKAPPGPLARVLRALQPMRRVPRSALVGAVAVVALVLAISILRTRPSAPPSGGESARPADTAAAPEVAEGEAVASVPEAPAVTEEVVTELSQPEPPEVAEGEAVASAPEAPAVTEEVITELSQPELPEVAEVIAAVPKAPDAEGESPAVSFPVQINAMPWATIEIDGQDFGETPLAGVPLPGGSHSFRARMPDGRVIERVVEIDADNRFVVFE